MILIKTQKLAMLRLSELLHQYSQDKPIVPKFESHNFMTLIFEVSLAFGAKI